MSYTNFGGFLMLRAKVEPKNTLSFLSAVSYCSLPEISVHLMGFHRAFAGGTSRGGDGPLHKPLYRARGKMFRARGFPTK